MNWDVAERTHEPSTSIDMIISTRMESQGGEVRRISMLKNHCGADILFYWIRNWMQVIWCYDRTLSSAYISPSADYYSRYRPGLVTVLVALTIFSCFIQYVYLLLQWGVSIQRIRACVFRVRRWTIVFR